MKKRCNVIVLLAICCIAMAGCGKTERNRGTASEVQKESALLLGKRVKLHCRHLLIQESRKQNKRIHGFALWETV